MRIEAITIRGFRCFDEAGETIDLDKLTCFVGPNASGKTAAMVALARMFGESRVQRQVLPSDFHLAVGEQLNTQPSRSLTVECRLGFPELDGDGDSEAAGVPETFNQMIVDEPSGTPYCRIRLEAKWTEDGTAFGDVDQSLWWILTSSDDDSVIHDGNRIRVQPGDRGRIRVIYIGAVRDPDEQIRATTATTFGRWLESLEWLGADEVMKETLADLQDEMEGIPGIETLNSEIQKTWNGFYDGRIAKEVAFKSADQDPASLVKVLAATFSPGENLPTTGLKDLSDGLRSLFSLSLSLGLFRVEELVRAKPLTSGFKASVVESAPIITLFAIEEPENHLSPQYLGRIMKQLDELSTIPRAQVVLSSHSPSILRRVEPDFVRYFLGHEQRRTSHVKKLPLPETLGDESFKYVRRQFEVFLNYISLDWLS